MAESYKDTLRIRNSNLGLDTTARAIVSGDGDTSPLYLSNTEVQIQSYTAVAPGSGFDGATEVTSYIQKLNGEYVSTYLLDIEDLLVTGTLKDVVGESGVSAPNAYFTQFTRTTVGSIYKVEMSCIEAPAGSNTTADLDLVTNSASLAYDATYDSTGSAIVLIAATKAWTVGMSMVTTAGTDFSGTNDDYLYLANGSGANSGGTFTAGKFIIKAYGANF